MAKKWAHFLGPPLLVLFTRLARKVDHRERRLCTQKALNRVVRESLPKIIAALQERSLSTRMWRRAPVKVRVGASSSLSCQTWDARLSDPEGFDRWFTHLTVSEARFKAHRFWHTGRGRLYSSFHGDIRLFDQIVSAPFHAARGSPLLLYKPCEDNFALRRPDKDVHSKGSYGRTFLLRPEAAHGTVTWTR